MKKSEKYIYLILGVIVLGIVIAGVAFAVTKGNDKDNKTPSTNEGNVDKPTNNDEKVTLTNEELENYLYYIPNDVIDYKQSAYRYPNNIEKIGDRALLGSTFDYAYEVLHLTYGYSDTYYFKKDDIEKVYYQLYNKKLNNMEKDSENDIADYNCMSYFYEGNESEEGEFRATGGCGENGTHISVIDSYEATNKELIIYEYAARDYSYNDESNNLVAFFINYQTDKETEITNITGTAEEYFKEHKTEFTKYKHTFKKNDKGYYWYSTEVA